MATTSWPGRSACESPSSAGFRSGAWMRTTARSVSGSSPTSSAGYWRPSASVTSMLGGAVDDVAVGQDEAVGREDEAGAAAVAGRAGGVPRRAAAFVADVEVDDGGAGLRDGADDGLGVGVEQRRVRRRAGGGTGGGTAPGDSSRNGQDKRRSRIVPPR